MVEWRIYYSTDYRRSCTLSTIKKESIDGSQNDNSSNLNDGKTTNNSVHFDITIGTLNTWDGRANWFKMAYKDLNNHKVNICITSETKSKEFHIIRSYGYSITAKKGTILIRAVM